MSGFYALFPFCGDLRAVCAAPCPSETVEGVQVKGYEYADCSGLNLIKKKGMCWWNAGAGFWVVNRKKWIS